MKKLLLIIAVGGFSAFSYRAAAQEVEKGTPVNPPKIQHKPLPAQKMQPSELQIKQPTISEHLFNRMVLSLQRIPLIGFIDEWYFTRYRMGGTTKKGVDCSSFTMQLFQEVYKISLPRTAKQQFDATVNIKEDEIAEGDLVFFNTRGGVSHVGVYLANGYFVHASSSRGVILSNLKEPYFNKRFLGARRMMGPQIFLQDLL